MCALCEKWPGKQEGKDLQKALSAAAEVMKQKGVDTDHVVLFVDTVMGFTEPEFDAEADGAWEVANRG